MDASLVCVAKAAGERTPVCEKRWVGTCVRVSKIKRVPRERRTRGTVKRGGTFRRPMGWVLVREEMGVETTR